MHDFIIPELGRANPYGVYDIANNAAWVSVGIDHDTASFAVETIRRWWCIVGADAREGMPRLPDPGRGPGCDRREGVDIQPRGEASAASPGNAILRKHEAPIPIEIRCLMARINW